MVISARPHHYNAVTIYYEESILAIIIVKGPTDTIKLHNYDIMTAGPTDTIGLSEMSSV